MLESIHSPMSTINAGKHYPVSVGMLVMLVPMFKKRIDNHSVREGWAKLT